MRIAFISTLGDVWGGSEVLWYETALYALEQNHTIAAFVSENQATDNRISQLKQKGAEIIVYPINKTAMYKSVFMKAFIHINFKRKLKNARTLFDKFKPERIIISQGDTFEAAKNNLFYTICEKYPKITNLISHGNFEHLIMDYNSILKTRILIPFIQTFFFVSHRNKEFAEHQIAHQINNYLHIANHPFLKTFDYIEYPECETIHFANVARFDVNFKAQDLLFQVFSQEKWKNRKWHLNLYGEGKDLNYLQDLLIYYHLSDRITLHGQVKDIHQIWKLNHILFLPSFTEGKPLVIQEAMMCGRPALVTEVAGNTELIEDNENGFVIDAPTFKLIDRKLEEAWEKRNTWKKLGLAAHQKAKECIDMNPEITLLNKVINKM